jgi:hypothetical protein
VLDAGHYILPSWLESPNVNRGFHDICGECGHRRDLHIGVWRLVSSRTNAPRDECVTVEVMAHRPWALSAFSRRDHHFQPASPYAAGCPHN